MLKRLPIHTALAYKAENCKSAQVLYACDPDAQLLERFDPLAVTFQLTTAPQHGDLTVAGHTSPVTADTACAWPAPALPGLLPDIRILHMQHCMRRLCCMCRLHRIEWHSTAAAVPVAAFSTFTIQEHVVAG